MNLVQCVRSLWQGARGVLGRRAKTTVVICPTMELPAAVELAPDHRLESCSRWPGLEGCSQSCISQAQYSAEDLNDFAARYEGRKCALCGAALSRDDWYKSRLAALDVQTGMPEVSGVVRTSSFSVPANSDPICSTCYGAKM